MKCNSQIIKWAYVKACDNELEVNEGRNYELVLVTIGNREHKHYFTTYRRAQEMKDYYWNRGYVNEYT